MGTTDRLSSLSLIKVLSVDNFVKIINFLAVIIFNFSGDDWAFGNPMGHHTGDHMSFKENKIDDQSNPVFKM